jgi:hypothetical protein
MTHRAGGPRHGIPKAWILPFLATAAILVAVYLGVVSRSIAIDFVAWWPVWAILVISAVLVRGRRLGRVRLSGLVPILTVVAVGLFATGHVLGWEAMPSASGHLVGPASGSATTVALSARVDGELEVGSGQTGFLYTVEPVRRGGDVGSPAAIEQVQGTSVSVNLEPVPEPGLYTFAGWRLDLDEEPTWNVTLGGEVEADLRGVRLTGLQVAGGGRVLLGTVPSSTVVNVAGAFEIVVPPDVPVRVVGSAVVPAGWSQSAEGSTSPTTGDGWVISVGDESSLSVTES